MTTPFKIALLAALFLAGLFIGLKSCNKQPEGPTAAKSEQKMQAQQTDDKVAHAVYVADTLRRWDENKALRERLTVLTGKVTTLQEKAKQSANTHAKTPSLVNCNHALNDCQQHAAALEDVVSIQDVQLTGYESAQRADRNEIARINSVKDSAFAGWSDAVQGWQKTEAELVKAKKPKRIGLGFQVGYGISEVKIAPYVGVGLSWNIVRL